MQAARLTAVVVLPTPPFWLATANVVTRDNLAGARGWPAWRSRARRSRRAAIAAAAARAARSDRLTAPAERALAGDSRPARDSRRCRRHLAIDVQMVRHAASIWFGADHTLGAQPELRRALARRRASAAPIAPFQATSVPPIASSGAAYSQTRRAARARGP
jgi:hypothetical protein